MFLENLKTVKSYKLLSFVGVGILCGGLGFGSYNLITEKRNDEKNLIVHDEPDPILRQTSENLLALEAFSSNFNEITTTLHKIDNQLNKPTIDIEPIQLQITDLAQQTATLSKDSKDLLNEAITMATKDLKDQLSNIQNELAELKDKQKKIVYVNLDNLPFKVLHIDNIQGNNITTIRYNNTIFPLTEGEYLAGWKLVSSKFNEQEVEFINEKKEHVLLALAASSQSTELALNEG